MDNSTMATPPEAAADSKKRTVEKMSPETFDDDDDDSTAGMLQELYQLRKRKVANSISMIFGDKLERDNQIVTLKEIKSEDKFGTDASIEETKEQPTKKTERKWLYLSKLLFYTKDQYRDYMITFNDMMYEDLNKDPKNSKWTLEAAFMSTYGYEHELIEPLLKANVWLVIANDMVIGFGNSQKLIESSYQGYPNLTIVHPPKVTDGGKAGIFHPKLWLLKFPSTLRVVVASGNLYTGSWSICCNGLWFQDFPRKKGKEVIKKEQYTRFDFNKDFKETLDMFLKAVVPWNMDYRSILKFDLNDYLFENIDVILIPSLTGRFRDQMVNKIGFGKITYVLDKFPCRNSNKPNRKIVSYMSSSVGKFGKNYVGLFAASVLPGYKTVQEYRAERHAKEQKQSNLSLPKKPDPIPAMERLRLIYPTAKYVEECITGVEAPHCLWLKREFYEGGKPPRGIFHKFEAPGIIPHLKVFVITDDDNEINDDTIIYFGSHNMSKFSWGKYEKHYTQLSIVNSELGILIPPIKGSAGRKKELIGYLPFKIISPTKYSDDDEPFVY